ncbi:MAG: hypothetical protein IPM29_09355 [Planctomycetes bacterium]|nr:hypothetical protein [Planctomycetota bacterium]
MCLVEDEHGPQTSRVDILDEAALEVAHEAREGAGRRYAGGVGDLAAHVALGQAGDLDVVRRVARLDVAARRARPRCSRIGSRVDHAQLDEPAVVHGADGAVEQSAAQEHPLLGVAARHLVAEPVDLDDVVLRHQALEADLELAAQHHRIVGSRNGRGSPWNRCQGVSPPRLSCGWCA